MNLNAVFVRDRNVYIINKLCVFGNTVGFVYDDGVNVTEFSVSNVPIEVKNLSFLKEKIKVVKFDHWKSNSGSDEILSAEEYDAKINELNTGDFDNEYTDPTLMNESGLSDYIKWSQFKRNWSPVYSEYIDRCDIEFFVHVAAYDTGSPFLISNLCLDAEKATFVKYTRFQFLMSVAERECAKHDLKFEKHGAFQYCKVDNTYPFGDDQYNLVCDKTGTLDDMSALMKQDEADVVRLISVHVAKKYPTILSKDAANIILQDLTDIRYVINSVQSKVNTRNEYNSARIKLSALIEKLEGIMLGDDK